MILEYAKLEIDDACEYYDLQQKDLGTGFKKDVQSCVDRILLSPRLYPYAIQNIRRSLLHRFPFSVFYAIEDDVIVILSVAHQNRRPFYWIEHIKI